VTISNNGVFTITATKTRDARSRHSNSFAVSRVFYVSPNGNDTTGNGTVAQPFRTIGKGVTTAITADTVRVWGGTYIGPVDLNKSWR